LISSIYLAGYGSTPDERLEWISTRLHPAVRERISRFRNVERRNQTILGRALLALALGELGEGPDTLSALSIRSNGAPRLPVGYSGSISHADGLVGAIAATGVSVGIDLEHCWDCHADPVISGRYRDLRRWTMSEAVAKASGASLLDVLAVPSIGGRILLDERWFTRIFFVNDSYMACVATSEPISRPSVIWLTRDAIRDRLAGPSQKNCASRSLGL
jgi:4'-phosphopantetheinyl transferase N-terminal domain